MKISKFLSVLLLVAASLLLTQCDNSLATSCDHYNYGEGIVYFSCTGDSFGDALSGWLEQHPDQCVRAMTSSGTGVYGRDIGYWVSFDMSNPSPATHRPF